MSSKKPIKILFIEDDPDSQALARKIFMYHGLSFVTASTAQEALQYCDVYEPQLIVTDLSLPDMQAENWISILRQREDLKKVPILVVSASSIQVLNKEQVLAFGANDFLLKPYRVDELVQNIKKYLKIPN